MAMGKAGQGKASVSIIGLVVDWYTLNSSVPIVKTMNTITGTVRC